MDRSWNVQFAGDFFVTTTTVYAKDEEQAEAEAAKLLMEHYGWDMNATANDVQVDGL